MNEEYMKWAKWEKANNAGPPLTGTQAEFAKYILGNEDLVELLQHPGNLLSVMKRVQRYLKDK